MFSILSHLCHLRFCLCVLLVVSIIATSSVPIFAMSSTPSVLKVTKTSPLNSAILAASDTAQNVFLSGYTTARTIWAYLSYNNSLAYEYTTPSTLPDLFSKLADVIGKDFVQINGHIVSIMDDVDYIRTDVNSIKSSASNINSVLNSILSYVDDFNTLAKSSDVSSAASDIVDAIENSGVSIPQTLLDDVSSIKSNTDTDKSRWAWNSTFQASGFSLLRYRRNGEGGIGSDLDVNPSNRSIPNQIWYWLFSLNNSVVNASRDLLSNVPISNTQTYLDKDLNTVQMGRTSFWRDFRNIGGNINDILARIGFVIASDADIQARQDAAATTQAAFNSFVKPSGSASVSSTDVGTLADIGSGVIDNLNTGVQASDSLDVFNQSFESWSWFTQQTADAFDSTGNNRNSNSLRSAPSFETPYLDAYYAEVMSHVR